MSTRTLPLNSLSLVVVFSSFGLSYQISCASTDELRFDYIVALSKSISGNAKLFGCNNGSVSSIYEHASAEENVLALVISRFGSDDGSDGSSDCNECN